MALHKIKLPRDLLAPKPRGFLAEDAGLGEDVPLGATKNRTQREWEDYVLYILQERTLICPDAIALGVRTKGPARVEAEIRRMVEAGDISTARNELAKIPVGTSKTLDKWKRLLAEPVVKSGRPASGQGMHSDILWLESHSAEYKGQWVALKSGKLLGSSPSSTALEVELAESDCLAGATFFKIEE